MNHRDTAVECDTLNHPRPMPTGPELVVLADAIMGYVLLRDWLAATRAEGYDVHIAAPKNEYWHELAALGFKMHEVYMCRRFNPFAQLRSICSVYTLVRAVKPMLVVTHGAAAGLSGRIAAKLARVAAIVGVNHGFIFDENMGIVKRRAFMFVETILSRISTGLVFINKEDYAYEVRANGDRKGTCFYISGGIDLAPYWSVAQIQHKRAETRVLLGLDESDIVVAFAGRLVKEKGVMEFVQVAANLAKKHRNVKFLVLGDANPGERGAVKTEMVSDIANRGLTARFRVMGFVPYITPYLAAADVLCHPSYKESLGRVIVEGMACQLPVVAFDVRGCRDVISDHATGALVPYRNTDAMTGIIDRWLQNPDERKMLGANGRRRAFDLFDGRIAVERYIRALAHIRSEAAYH